LKSGASYGEFARVWGISRHTLYIWMKRYRESGPQGLEHPTGTGRRGRKPLAPAVREEIVAVQRRFPDFGLRKMRDFLARFRGLRVSTHGVRAAVVAAGVPRAQIPPRRRLAPAMRRFERSRPGELWQSDITSYVLARPGRRVYLVVFLDDFSRYVVAWSLHFKMTAAAVSETLLDGVSRFGKPQEVLTDQGPQYFAWRGRCDFQKLLEREGIEHVVARTHHPQTLGKCERLWETVGRELWDRARPRDLADAQARLGHYFRHYNHFRPHQGIGGLVPADRFFGAEKAAREAIEAAMEKNELLVALGERPRTAVFLFGQIGEEQVSLHGERGRLVVSTPQGSQEVDFEDLGTGQEAKDDAHHHDGSDDGDRRDGACAGAADAPGAGTAQARQEAATGLPDAGLLRAGERGGAETEPRAGGDHPGVLDGAEDEAGGREGARRAADPGLADEPACGDGSRVRAAETSLREEGAAGGDERRGEGDAQGARAPAQGERPAEGADRGPAGAAGEPGPGPARGDAGEGGRGEEAAEEEKRRGRSSAGPCGSGSAAGLLSTGSSASSRSSPG
jgi:transposase InsO family protein